MIGRSLYSRASEKNTIDVADSKKRLSKVDFYSVVYLQSHYSRLVWTIALLNK